MKSLLFLIVGMLVLSGCVKRDIGKTFEEKYDAKLKLVLNDPEYSKTEKPIQCVVEMYKNLDFILKDKLENVGLKVITSSGNIIVVEGSAASIRKAARYDFIHRISISKEYTPQ